MRSNTENRIRGSGLQKASDAAKVSPHKPTPKHIPGVVRQKKIPYKEGKIKDVGSNVGYTILRGRATKGVGAGLQMCYYPEAPPFHVMAVLSGTRVAWVLCV